MDAADALLGEDKAGPEMPCLSPILSSLARMLSPSVFLLPACPLETLAMAAALPRCSWQPRALRACVKLPLVARSFPTDGIDEGSQKLSARSPFPELRPTVVADDWLDSSLPGPLQRHVHILS
jgi:hypothetical protein